MAAVTTRLGRTALASGAVQSAVEQLAALPGGRRRPVPGDKL